MDKILDGDYAHDFKPLVFNENGTGLLSVDLIKWKKELVRLERRTNKGCVIYFIVFFVFLFVGRPVGINGYVLLTITFSPLIYKMINAFLFMNLVRHGWYDYEIYSDKIVRYTNTDYRSLDWTSCRKIKKRDFGIVVEKKWRPWNFLKNRFNSKIILIPNKVQGYEQIVTFLQEENLLK